MVQLAKYDIIQADQIEKITDYLKYEQRTT